MTNIIKIGLLLLSLASFFSLSGQAYAGEVAKIFTNQMVLQRDKPVPVWGTANNGEAVRVSFKGQVKNTTTQNGRWMVKLDPMAPSNNGTQMSIKIGASQTINLNDVVVGDVWLAGGQSNMAQQLKNHLDGERITTNGNIRFFKHPLRHSNRIFGAGYSSWFKSGDGPTGDFSPVAYFFAHKLKEAQKNIPIGVIQSVWGGTPVETYMSANTLRHNPKFAPLLNWTEANSGQKAFQLPTKLNEGMIKPLQPFAVAGFIWYQGESNTDKGGPNGSEVYRELFVSLIREWRFDFDAVGAPFLFVQLASFNGGNANGDKWAFLREQQLLSLSEKNTAMAVTVDVGERNEIHPLKKKPVGDRLALAARKLYLNENLNTYMSPIPVSAVNQNGKITVTFSHVGQGLKPKSGNVLYGFETCVSDSNCKSATAKIVGNNTVEITGTLANAKFARYGWKNWTEYNGNLVNLVNSLGLPASPFRSHRLSAESQDSVFNIPARIQAEDYHDFYDTTDGNIGNSYRSECVDIQETQDVGGGYNVGWIDTGEWLEYKIRIGQADDYTANLRLAAANAGGLLSIEIDGQSVGNALMVGSTGGFMTWETKVMELGALSAGEHTLRVRVQSGGFNLNWLDVVKKGGTIGPDPTSKDQCNTTAECKNSYSNATDCKDSASANSVCMCGNTRCDA